MPDTNTVKDLADHAVKLQAAQRALRAEMAAVAAEIAAESKPPEVEAQK